MKILVRLFFIMLVMFSYLEGVKTKEVHSEKQFFTSSNSSTTIKKEPLKLSLRTGLTFKTIESSSNLKTTVQTKHISVPSKLRASIGKEEKWELQ